MKKVAMVFVFILLVTSCMPNVLAENNSSSGRVIVNYYLDGVIFDQDQLIITNSKTVYPRTIPEYDCLSSEVYVTFDNKTGQCSPSIISFEYKKHSNEYDSGEIIIQYYLDGILSETKHFTISNSQQINPKSISNYECLSSGVYVTFDKKTGECTPSIISFDYRMLSKEYDNGEITIRYYFDGILSEEKTQAISYSQTVHPDNFANYECTSSSVYITFDKKTGICSPRSINFYYSKRNLSTLPLLSGISGVKTVGNGNLPVYTGPDWNYYRSASGKAAVSSGENVTVYGRVDDWVFIQYDAWYSSKNMYITRFAYIPANQIERGPKYFEVEFGAIPIRISSSAQIGDEPATTHYYNSFDNWDNNNAIALARINMNGMTWIYFESYANSSQGYKPFRGFVQEQYVSMK